MLHYNHYQLTFRLEEARETGMLAVRCRKDRLFSDTEPCCFLEKFRRSTCLTLREGDDQQVYIF